MKRLLYVLIAGVALLFISCADKEDNNGKSGQVKKNLESVQAVVNAFETGDVSKIDDVVSADFIDHTERGDLGRDSLKAMITAMHTSISDLKFYVVREMADDEYTMSWYKLTGTSDGYMGMPKGPFSMNSIDVVKHKDGKAVEHWSFGEMREVMQMMMGMVAPQPGTAEKKDSIPPVK
jgi:predicted SnoaL-like aldol condensation-catalyzing enzyme